MSLATPNNDFSSVTGLVGEIGKRKFNFYPSVQDKTQTFAVMNKNLIKGTLKIRKDSVCSHFSVNDLLYPLKISNFLFQQI